MKLTRAMIEERNEQVFVLRQLWSSLLPERMPSEPQFHLWISMYGADIAEQAINITGQNQNKREDDEPIIDLVRYASGVMVRLRKEAA